MSLESVEDRYNKYVEGIILSGNLIIENEDKIYRTLKENLNNLKNSLEICTKLLSIKEKLNLIKQNQIDQTLTCIKYTNIFYWFNMIKELNFPSNSKPIINRLYYSISHLKYLNLSAVPFIDYNDVKSIIDIKFTKHLNLDLIRIITNKLNRTCNYFLQSLVINILRLSKSIFIGGGFVRDLFVKSDEPISTIDIDIYIEKTSYIRLLEENYIIDNKSYNKFYIIVDTLSRLIFKKSCILDGLYSYKFDIKSELKSLCMIFKFQTFVLKLDINPVQPRNKVLNSPSFDFNINELGLRINETNNPPTLEVFNRGTQPIDLLVSPDILNKEFNFTSFNNIIPIINSFLSKEDPILNINSILEKKAILCHYLCHSDSSTPSNFCSKKDCSNCNLIIQKLYLRYIKFKDKFDIDLKPCGHTFCISNLLDEYIKKLKETKITEETYQIDVIKHHYFECKRLFPDLFQNRY
jgi:hypothetical protein